MKAHGTGYIHGDPDQTVNVAFNDFNDFVQAESNEPITVYVVSPDGDESPTSVLKCELTLTAVISVR